MTIRPVHSYIRRCFYDWALYVTIIIRKDLRCAWSTSSLIACRAICEKSCRAAPRFDLPAPTFATFVSRTSSIILHSIYIWIPLQFLGFGNIWRSHSGSMDIQKVRLHPAWAPYLTISCLSTVTMKNLHRRIREISNFFCFLGVIFRVKAPHWEESQQILQGRLDVSKLYILM